MAAMVVAAMGRAMALWTLRAGWMPQSPASATQIARVLLGAALCLVPVLGMAPAQADERLTSAEVREMARSGLALAGGHGGGGQTEDLMRRLYSMAKADFGADSPEVTLAEIAVATAVLADERFAEGLDLASRTFPKVQRLLPETDPFVYQAVMNLASGLIGLDRADEALSLLADGVRLAEVYLPPGAVETRTMRMILARGAIEAGQTSVAIETLDALLAGMALDAAGTGQGAQDARMLSGMAQFLRAKALWMRDGSAACHPAAEAAVAALDDAFDVLKNPDVMPLRREAVILWSQCLTGVGARDKAEAVIAPLLTAVEAEFGRDSIPFVLVALQKVRAVFDSPDNPRVPELAALMREVVAAAALVLDPRHTARMEAETLLATLLAAQGDRRGALEVLRKTAADPENRDRDLLLYVLHSGTVSGDLTERAAVDMFLEHLQTAQRGAAARAQAMLNARLAMGPGQGAALLRERTDLGGIVAAARADLVRLTADPLEQRDMAAVDAARDRLQGATARVDALDQQLRAGAGQVARASGAAAMSLDAIQAALAPDEALVVLDVLWPGAGGQSLVIVVTDSLVRWRSVDAEPDKIEAAIATLRAGIDLRLGVRSAVALDDGTAAAEGRGDAGPPVFDTAQAEWLYQALLGKVDPLIAGKAHLLFDLRGPVTALPPGLLRTGPAVEGQPAPWLIRRQAVTILPAIAALETQGLARTPAPEALIAFADPDFTAPTGAAEPAPAEPVPTGMAGLRAGLAPLPETVVEAQAVARALGAGAGALHLGADASEAALKSAALDRADTLYFATHGLISGDRVAGRVLEEPALVLTAGQGEDGFLTASEIADLKLAARFVVLSACNTAVGGPGAETLSGLAQAFLYAGARGLLVSHWPVESRSAVRLMTDTFRIRAENPGIRAAEAQRRAMLAMIDGPRPDWHHPAYWAPFVIVGRPD